VSELDSLSPLQQQALRLSCAQSKVPVHLADPRTIEQITALLRSPATSPPAAQADVDVPRLPKDAGSGDEESDRIDSGAPSLTTCTGGRIQGRSHITTERARPSASATPQRCTNQVILRPNSIDEPAA
jgi:hypothetical protein